MCSEHLRATDLLGQSTSIFALKNAKGGIIASDTLTTYLASGRYHDSEYTEMLPPECIHPKGRYVLLVDLPLPLGSAPATDKEVQTVASVRTYFDGKLLHSGPYGHTYWQLTELTPGVHDLEIRITDNSFRVVLKGFRRSLSVREAPPVGAPDGLCDFDNDREETLLLSAAPLPSMQQTAFPSQEGASTAPHGQSGTIDFAFPIEGDSICKGTPIQLSMRFPSSVSSGRGRLLLITLDGSAALVPLNDMNLPGCFEIDPAVILNPRQSHTLEHVFKALVVIAAGSCWQSRCP
jgi:hypothetical protein